MQLVHGSLFAGIGGFDLAAQMKGWINLFHCEKDTFCNTILNYYWPNAIHHEDIRFTDFSIYRGLIDVLSGGFPCQPYSSAGKRKGKDDDRHLWPEFLRAIRQIQPVYVVGENVRGLINWNGGMVFDEVQADLENEGFEVLPFLLPAAGCDAPHERYRIFFVAYSRSNGLKSGRFGKDRPAKGSGKIKRLQRKRIRGNAGRTGQPEAAPYSQSGGDRGRFRGMEEAHEFFAAQKESQQNASQPRHDGAFRNAADPGGLQRKEWHAVGNIPYQKEEGARMEHRIERSGHAGYVANTNRIDEHGTGLRAGKVSLEQAPGLLGNRTGESGLFKEHVTDPACERYQRQSRGSGDRQAWRVLQEEFKTWREFIGSGKNASDTRGIELQRRMHANRSEKAERYFGACAPWTARSAWENFPTQSPLCSRDDGFSTGLDADTVFKGIRRRKSYQPFGRWRQSSIKGAGNAVVPELVYKDL